MSGEGPWVEKRLAWLERAKGLRPGAVDVSISLTAPGGAGAKNRHGMPSLPPGQHLVENWPVLDLGHQPSMASSDWRLEVCGEVERPVILTWGDLMSLPQVEVASDFHCVTSWTRLGLKWEGVLFSRLCEEVIPTSRAHFVATQGADREPGSGRPYTTSLTLEDSLAPDVMLAHSCEGAPLTSEHGGPVRMITPRQYAWKGSKWIERVEFLSEDRLGYWEERGYSNTALPWLEDRFSSQGGEDE